VPDSNHLDDESVIEDLVHDAVVADPNSIGVRLAGHGSAARGTGIVGEEVDCSPNPVLFPAR
jgi:hypothetical protein